jgi:hypothetical protein
MTMTEPHPEGKTMTRGEYMSTLLAGMRFSYREMEVQSAKFLEVTAEIERVHGPDDVAARIAKGQSLARRDALNSWGFHAERARTNAAIIQAEHAYRQMEKSRDL